MADFSAARLRREPDLMATDEVGHVHARETREAFRKAEVWDRFERLAKDLRGNAILCELFKDLALGRVDYESVRELVAEQL